MTDVVFLGTPQASVPALLALVERANIVAVITQPDRPQGRSNKPVPSPVKEVALTAGLRVVQPETRDQLNEALRELEPTDLGVVVAYGMILDQAALAIPRHGMVNVHFSLLPRWRGAAPVERAILAGDKETGVTIMKMDLGLDTGDVVASEIVAIDEATAGQLTEVLSQVGASLLMDIFENLSTGRAQGVPQANEHATYAAKLTTIEAEIDFSASTQHVLRHIRAYNPRPGAYAFRDGERFKVWEAQTAAAGEKDEPGDLIGDEEGLTIKTGDGAVRVLQLQPSGKPRMGAREWVRGQQQPLGRFSVKGGHR